MKRQIVMLTVTVVMTAQIWATGCPVSAQDKPATPTVSEATGAKAFASWVSITRRVTSSAS